ncbi:YbjN domain-containing protein [Saprospira grandis]|uniref:Molecular chaperone Tir n=1 Tax=Saprospira grandis (strain Lewin) TaxID=984262 RepID=H6KZ28_SAPGL|nr:YbjN domain-containing protein [Saprospira grandis]AFC23312.1 hypothetical protein SGRA_0573 [Saprospira grandis str. Lewin]
MNSFEKVKNYLLDMGHEISHESVEDNLFVLNNENQGICNLMLDCEGDVLVMEQHIFDIEEKDAAFLKRLLQINRELIHGAFVLDEEGRRVLFRDTLALENLDRNELESSINAMAIALVEHAEEFMDVAAK